MKHNKIIQYEGKPCWEASVVMLATDKSFIGYRKDWGKETLYLKDRHIITNDKTWQAIHLYITSNEPIKEGDWCLYNNLEILQVQQIAKESIHFDNGEFEVYTNKFTTRKIIASTNESLDLPQPSQAFIESFVKANDVEFDEILIEVEDVAGKLFHSGHSRFELLIDQNHNTITIHPFNNVRQKLINHLESNHIEASKRRVEVIMNFIDTIHPIVVYNLKDMQKSFEAGARFGYCQKSIMANVGASCREPNWSNWSEQNLN
jgi:hypothetical protein